MKRFISSSLITFGRLFSSNVNKFTTRTHNCGELTKKDIGKKVEIYGWLLKERFAKFLIIHDKYGFVQAKIPENSMDLTKIASDLRNEDVLKVVGIVKSRGKDANPKMKTGEIEIEVENLEVLNTSRSMPFSITSVLKPELETDVENKKKMTFRYLELRKPSLQKAIHLRAEIVKKMRRCLEDKFGFIEIETPTLATHTPGGAAEFVVPTQLKGETYALPQSPQLYKQLLMIGQMDRYYQIARCYRDETVKGDRQPEFTQVDLELSFTTQEKVLSLIEQLIHDSWPDEMAYYKPKIPFQRLPFMVAMKNFGTDKPDLRFPWKFEDCSDVYFGTQQAYAFVVRKEEGKLPSNNKLKKDFAKLYPDSFLQNLSFYRNDEKSTVDGNEAADERFNERLCLRKDDLLVCGFDEKTADPMKILTTLGFARTYIADILGRRSQRHFNFLWVTNFPLFVESETNPNILESAHHPFTAPIDEDKEKLMNLEDLKNIRAQHYDLVVNGIEMGGGSIRINNSKLQKFVFDEILKFPTDTLEPFLNALSFGAPPHGGFALGLDRYVACLNAEGDAKSSVREVIVFPKTKEGKCLMMKTPFEPDDEMKKRYGFEFTKGKND